MKFKQLFIFILFTLLSQNTLAANSKNPIVNIETTMGSFTLELYPDKAPKTVENFLRYVHEGFYNNTIFHRVIPNFVVQGGGFKSKMQKKSTHPPVINESNNALKNVRGSISMARTRAPNSATSQFFINVVHNPSLDSSQNNPGYCVFGKIIDGMQIIDNIVKVPTSKVKQYQDVPKKEVMIISAKTDFPVSQLLDNNSSAVKTVKFVEGEHYTLLQKPIPTRNNKQIEVIEMFSYGCPHCYEFEPLLSKWSKEKAGDIDFWKFPAVWNKPMELFAQAYYTADKLKVLNKVHPSLFHEVVISHKSLKGEQDFSDFFAKQGINTETFNKTFNSDNIMQKVRKVENLVKTYKPAGVPEIIVNGKYRVDRMRSNGLKEMLDVINFLIEKERNLIGQS